MSEIKVELQETLGSDRMIAEAAWTSSLTDEKKDLKTEADVKRVVNMLADLKHSTPFESVVFRFWLRLPIAIDRQHMTHRIASHSGMSGRYRTMPDDWYGVPQDVKDILSKFQPKQIIPLESFEVQYNIYCKWANRLYNDSIKRLKYEEKNGVISNLEFKRVREFFRGVLPQHNMTERVTLMNLRSFSNYYKLRSKSDAQVEMQIISKSMLEEIKKKNICPIALEALERNNWSI